MHVSRIKESTLSHVYLCMAEKSAVIDAAVVTPTGGSGCLHSEGHRGRFVLSSVCNAERNGPESE